jgi:phage gpG-like protein
MAEDFIIKTDVVGLDKLLAKLEASVRSDVIKLSLYQGAETIAGWVKKNKLSGPRPSVLGVVSNRLRSSISASKTEQLDNEYRSKIGTNVKYARIHEYGGLIRAINAKFLRFKTSDGKWHAKKEVSIPARPFLRPAIEDEGNQREVLNILTENINTAIERAK